MKRRHLQLPVRATSPFGRPATGEANGAESHNGAPGNRWANHGIKPVQPAGSARTISGGEIIAITYPPACLTDTLQQTKNVFGWNLWESQTHVWIDSGLKILGML